MSGTWPVHVGSTIPKELDGGCIQSRGSNVQASSFRRQPAPVSVFMATRSSSSAASERAVTPYEFSRSMVVPRDISCLKSVGSLRAAAAYMTHTMSEGGMPLKSYWDVAERSLSMTLSGTRRSGFDAQKKGNRFFVPSIP